MTESENSNYLSQEMTPKFNLEKKIHSREFSNLIDFLDEAKSVVDASWVDYMVTAIHNLPDSDDKKALYRIIKDDAGLRNILEKENFRKLETLRFVGKTNLWQEILTSISEREIATTVLAKEWLDHLSNQELKNLGLSRNEISLFLCLSLLLQTPIDTAYKHQLELADAPGGKDRGPHAQIDGYEYLYDGKPFIEHEQFSVDFSQIVSILETFSDRVAQETVSGHLPPIYKNLSRYLKTLAESYGSHETVIKKIMDIWKNVDQEYIQLAESGCPILLTPWGFLNDGGHIGIELMVTINLQGKSSLHSESLVYLSLVSDFMKKYNPDYSSIPFIHQYVFVKKGLSLPWSGTACAGDRYVVFYDNENDYYAHHIYNSHYHKYIDGHTTEERFTYVRGINTVAHESGHLPRMLDEAIYKKMGVTVSINKIDEAKADLMANLLYLRRQSSSNPSDITPEEFLEQYIIGYIDDLKSSHNHEEEDIGIVWYSFSDKLILLKLFSCGAIRWQGNKIKIVDGLLGVKALAQSAMEIFELYGDPAFKEPELNAYVGHIEASVQNNEDVQRFLNMIYQTN